MLSDAAIIKFMHSGDIVVKPFSEADLRPAGITLHLGPTLRIPEADSVADLTTGATPRYQEVLLSDKDSYTLEPGAFAVAQTFERVGISQKIGMMIDGRSTLGRLGLSVHATSAVFDTGEEPKFVTLQLKNTGPTRIVIGPNVAIARAVFFLLNPPARRRYDSYGRYRADDRGTPAL
jgi:dCTP deaminase